MEEIEQVNVDEQVEIGFLEGIRARLPENYDVLRALGDLYTKVGRVQEGLEVDLELASCCGDDPNVWYNLACSYSLDGQVDAAFEALHRALDLGYEDIHWLTNDDDLAVLHADERFADVLARFT